MTLTRCLSLLTSYKAIFELILTEAAYVRDLQLIVEVRKVLLHDAEPNTNAPFGSTSTPS